MDPTSMYMMLMGQGVGAPPFNLEQPPAPKDRSTFPPQPFPTVPKKKDPETDLAAPPAPIPASPEAVASPLSNPYAQTPATGYPSPGNPQSPAAYEPDMLLKGPAPQLGSPFPSDISRKNPFEGTISDVPPSPPSSQRQDLLATLGYKPNKNYELDPRMNAESRWQARQQDAQDYNQQLAQPKGPPPSSYGGYSGSGAKVPVYAPERQPAVNPVTLATKPTPEGLASYNARQAAFDQQSQQNKEASRQKLVQLANLAQQFARAGRLPPAIAARLAQQAGLPSQQPVSSPLIAAMTGR